MARRPRKRLCESVEAGHSAHDRSEVIGGTLGLQAEPVRLDSQAKYATVADGGAEIYLRLPVDAKYQEKIWDHAAGVAGGHRGRRNGDRPLKARRSTFRSAAPCQPIPGWSSPMELSTNRCWPP
ncbi:MAG: hypothetical protein CM1200mP2_04600 [Planctomycetaceae bacterium]|nr:MAG: hypothetical protein CM1200mP2_04600 [Planctomycetaceae bacterium]